MKRISVLFGVIGFHFIFFLVSSCFTPHTPKQTDRYASLSDSTGYVGMNTCRQCHADKYRSFVRTGMGLSFDSASREKSSAKFEDAIISDRNLNFQYAPFWSGDSLYLKEFRLAGTDTVYSRTERIHYIVGSGQHTNSHLMNVNGYVTQVPATYYTQKGTWDLPPGFEHGFNSRFSRKIGLECMSCHNAFPEVVLGSENKFSRIPNGIDCERCHGPGGEHIRQKQAGLRVDTSVSIDFSIVNPSKLPLEMQMDVCQRCHIQGNAVLKDGKSFFDFRPGMHLSDVMDVYMPVYQGDDDSHIMASHAERLKLSACFRKSNLQTGPVESKANFRDRHGLSCITCHNPHVSVLETGSDQFNRTCRQCHDGNSHENRILPVCSESAENRRDANDNCVKCHMPRNGTIDIPHVSTTDHFIRKPVRREDVKKIKEFVTLACINNPKSGELSRGIAFLNYYEKFESNSTYLLDSAKRYLPDQTEEDLNKYFSHLVRWAFLKNDYAAVIGFAERKQDALARLSVQSYSNDDAWTGYRIAEAYLKTNQRMKALQFLQRTVDLAPFVLDFRNKLAQLQFDSRQFKEARKNLEFIINENPRYVSAYVNLGYLILTVNQDVEGADLLYTRALALDPDHEQALFNKAGAMLYLGRQAEAIKLLKHLLKVNPDHARARAMLKSISTGRKPTG